MKRANWIVVVTLAAVALSGMASAQRLASNSTIVTQVPFEFMVGNKAVPAGEWSVQAATMDGKTLAIRNAGAHVSLVSSISESETAQRASNYAMVFERYGDRYFLSGIKLEGSNVIYNVPQSKAEKELSARNVPATEELVLSARK